MNSVEVPDLPDCIGFGSWFHISLGLYALISLLGFCVLDHKDKVYKDLCNLRSNLNTWYFLFSSGFFKPYIVGEE